MSSDNLTTQPMLNAIMERLNEIDAKFTRELGAIRSDLANQQRELGAIRSDLANQQHELEAIRSEVAALAKSVRSIEKRWEVISLELIKVRADVRDIDERIESLEQKPA